MTNNHTVADQRFQSRLQHLIGQLETMATSDLSSQLAPEHFTKNQRDAWEQARYDVLNAMDELRMIARETNQ